MKHPKEITLTEEQVDTLRSTIQILELDASLKTILTGLLDNHIWLQHELHEKKISMSRLKSYFGIKSEKHAKASSNDKEMPSSKDESDDGGDSGGTVALKPSDTNKTCEKQLNLQTKRKAMVDILLMTTQERRWLLGLLMHCRRAGPAQTRHVMGACIKNMFRG